MSVNNSLDSVLDMSVQKLYGPWNNSFFKEKTNLFLDSVLVLGPNNVYNLYKFPLHEREILSYMYGHGTRNSLIPTWITHMNNLHEYKTYFLWKRILLYRKIILLYT